MRKVIVLVVLSFIFIQCGKDKESLIAKNQVGKLNNKTQIEELDILFKNDSIVKLPGDMDVIREYKIYETGGDHILTIRPNFEVDSVKLIESVQIFSDRFITDRSITTASVYSDILDSYSINKIEPTFSTAILFIDELNATIALDKKDLRIDEFDMRKISQDQIPDNAKIKYITIWFD
jgi:hypothetical protein